MTSSSPDAPFVEVNILGPSTVTIKDMCLKIGPEFLQEVTQEFGVNTALVKVVFDQQGMIALYSGAILWVDEGVYGLSFASPSGLVTFVKTLLGKIAKGLEIKKSILPSAGDIALKLSSVSTEYEHLFDKLHPNEAALHGNFSEILKGDFLKADNTSDFVIGIDADGTPPQKTALTVMKNNGLPKSNFIEFLDDPDYLLNPYKVTWSTPMKITNSTEADVVSNLDALKSAIPLEPPKTAPSAPVPMELATSMYQPVLGTTSTYYIVALGDGLQVAANISGTVLSVRYEGEKREAGTDTDKWLNSCGFVNKGKHTVLHVDMKMPFETKIHAISLGQRTLASLIAASLSPYKTPIPMYERLKKCCLTKSYGL